MANRKLSKQIYELGESKKTFVIIALDFDTDNVLIGSNNIEPQIAKQALLMAINKYAPPTPKVEEKTEHSYMG
jgi:hypothetical protein